MKKLIIINYLFLLTATILNGQQINDIPSIESKELAKGLYCISIDGINAMVLIDSAGNTLLSDNFKDFHTPQLLKEIKSLGSKRIVYMINTHFHKDHCGGNNTINEAIIISHINTKKGLETDHISNFWQDTSLRYPDYALPDLTFTEEMTIYFGGEEIVLTSFPGGHTNSDIVVYFKSAHVLHMSDLLFSIGFPAIDSERGGNAEIFATHLNKIIEYYPDNTVFVAGHGNEFSKEELSDYQKMISESAIEVRKAMQSGLSLEQIKEKQILAKWNKWANGYFTCNDWAEILYYDMQWSDSLSSFFHLNELNDTYIDTVMPDNAPLIYAPGIISTQGYEGCSGFNPEMDEFIFQRWFGNTPRLYSMKRINSRWTKPELIKVHSDIPIYDFTISPEGNRIVYASSHQIDELGKDQSGHNIFFMERTEKGWSQTKEFEGLGINTKYHDSYPCIAKNGNLYFFSNRPTGLGKTDIYFSEFKNGCYSSPVNMGEIINSEHDDWDPYIAPDESYIIFCSKKKGTYGEDDLYISFKTINEKWGTPVNMGSKINTKFSENRPYVSPDGKYLFFTRNETGNRDIYWISTSIFNELRQ